MSHSCSAHLCVLYKLHNITYSFTGFDKSQLNNRKLAGGKVST